MEYTLCALKESLRKYSVVPVVTRNAAADGELLGYAVPKGSWLIVHIQGIHRQYQQPLEWRPERYMPGGEYDQFPADIRPYMVSWRWLGEGWDRVLCVCVHTRLGCG